MGTRATWEQFGLVRAAFEDLTVSAEPEFADTDKAGSTPDEVQNADGIGSQRKTVALKDALLQYDAVSRILKIEKREKEHTGLIAVCTGGTSDIPVAEEAAATAEYFGARCVRIYDVGVSGLHRLFSALREIQQANCVIAVAGMEGALPSVLGGLVENPVIAVPSSVGYGASFGGLSALLTMINSCANGIAVVNIDNGFGAGYLATQVNRLATAGQGKTD
ncbi:MAG: nickel pincer cofactor biosynthesis protein LarB [Lachnospiraceae bacterium]|nr:nickel pincer cofactor biosynthesis protein LarB [Lachnospiraceae bacterium]